jgi:putative hemolysin
MTNVTDFGRLPHTGEALFVANTAPEAVEKAVRQHRPALKILGGQVFTLDRQGALLSALPQQHSPVVPSYLTDTGLRIGTSITSERLHAIARSEDRLAYLEWRISLLAESAGVKTVSQESPEPVTNPVPVHLLELDVRALSPACRLAASDTLEVFLAGSREIPNVLHEIGRLRELTFRAAGEGTGRAVDLDYFDHQYFHLFVWNAAKREVVGAYRLRSTDGGPASLYTATLFQYGTEFLSRMGPALELGRSFIRAEYQRSFAPLLLLWKAIGRFVTAHPRYRTLFGPVSISNQYSVLSRELMIAFLEKREWLTDLAGLIRPRQAPSRRGAPEHCRDIDDLSDVVSDLEAGDRGVPVLLRQYLRLGGKLLGFNVDPQFSNALDGLILVDLTRTEPRLLERYLGKSEAHIFLEYWKG